jgi:hypothetical protein
MRMLFPAALMVLLCSTSCAQSNCRIYLASQYDWGAKTGFYLDLEGAKLASLPVILGVADGRDWRFISATPPFEVDRDYDLKATLGPAGCELWVDGVSAGSMPDGWAPAAGNLETNYRPAWSNEPGDWLAIVSSVVVTVTRDGQEVARQAPPMERAEAAVALQLFEPGLPSAEPLDTRPGDTVTVEVGLRFGSSDIRQWAPFIDPYGQCRYADYPGKVTDDQQLRDDIAAEDAILQTMPPAEGYDAFGGATNLGWKEQGTGFFRTLRRDGKWWLITPDGNPCFYVGVCAAPSDVWETTPVTDREFLWEWLPPREGPYAAAWRRDVWSANDGSDYACLHTCNLVRKYGEGWRDRTLEQSRRRLKAWGFSGGGKWGSPAGMVDVPVLGSWGTPRLAGHVDVFDPAMVALLRADLETQMRPRLEDPWVLGWSLGNEYDEIIKRAEVREIMGRPAATPAKRAMLDHVLATTYKGVLADLCGAWKVEAADMAALYATAPNPPDADVETMRLLYEDRYYQTIYETVKSIDPNHLYMGCWVVPGWWESEDDWLLVAKHCDVVGYDRYTREYAEERLRKLQEASGKPTFCGEYSFPAWYGGARGFGRYGCNARDEAEAGDLYYRWIQGAAADPYCVGMSWFFYRDQPLTGRGAGRGERLVLGEHFAFGLITETDRPKWPLVRKMREANLQAATWREKAGH